MCTQIQTQTQIQTNTHTEIFKNKTHARTRTYTQQHARTHTHTHTLSLSPGNLQDNIETIQFLTDARGARQNVKGAMHQIRLSKFLKSQHPSIFSGQSHYVMTCESFCLCHHAPRAPDAPLPPL